MKTVLIATTISFLCIFGGLFAWAQHQAAQRVVDGAGTPLTSADIDASELVFAALEAERASVAEERRELLGLRQDIDLRANSIREQTEALQAATAELREEQGRYSAAREASIQKLANMFSAMKPKSAAPIFATLERGTALDILALMKDKSAAKLLSALSPSLAADLSTRLSLQGMP